MRDAISHVIFIGHLLLNDCYRKNNKESETGSAEDISRSVWALPLAAEDGAFTEHGRPTCLLAVSVPACAGTWAQRSAAWPPLPSASHLHAIKVPCKERATPCSLRAR